MGLRHPLGQRDRRVTLSFSQLERGVIGERILERLDPLGELVPAEQARIVRLLVERVEVGPTGADIRLRVEGLKSLVRDLDAISPDTVRAAA